MTDRVIVYPGALPQDTDQLYTNKFAMIAEAFQNAAILGNSTVVAGLACTPTAPASLQVNIGTGSIFQIDPTDATPYGSLGVDNASIMKMGTNQAPVTLTITPPSTAGYSQVYLVQAILQDVDAGATVLSYYNSSNPLQPYSGPNNSGSSNYTQRLTKCTIALKAGVAATTGTQTAPTPDAGYVGLYTITVANGATQITSAAITQLSTAPFFPTLPSVPSNVQNGTWLWGTDTGAANAYVVNVPYPVPVAYVAGMTIRFKAANANSGASTVNVNGLGAVAIKRAGGAALASGDILSGQVLELTYDGVNFQMANYLGISAGTTTNNFTSVNIPYVNDTGAQNALVATYSPAITSGQQIAGLFLSVKLANAITGACTINVNGLGVKNLMLGDLTNPPYNVFTAGMVLLIVYDGTQYQIVGTSQGIFAKKPTANYTIYVNTSTGSDTLYDGTSATVGTGTSGPLKTIRKAVNVAYGYSPSQYTITIQVAAGTYNESIQTPAYAGPNLVINGAGSTQTYINSGAGNCFYVTGPNTMTVQNVSAQTNGLYPWAAFAASQGATLNTNNTATGNASIVFYAATGATTNPGNHTFNGNSNAIFWPIYNGSINLGTYTYTFSTAISVTWGVGYPTGLGSLSINNVNPPTFVNPSFVSGPKYRAGLNGIISANGLGANFLPGSVAGTTDTGGQVSW